MNLKRLELSGFKSFARPTTLEFPSKITGIVGPNGSGKSNVAEGIRWVLGEQSMKSLRGKRGEDLIWNGSSQAPRTGKASVSLVFDNKDQRIPLDFNEVSLTRKIFRDGVNEYYINQSQVRLKDVVELMARIGLGEQKHNIIGQGEVDKIIMASPRERREMLEEAMGLRIYQLKKNEAERKLEHTETNMQQVEALLREIGPHLKFLKTQAQKAEARETVEAELKEFLKVYFAKEEKEIEHQQKLSEARAKPLQTKISGVQKEMAGLLAHISAEEKRIFSQDEEKGEEEKKIGQMESRRRDIIRDLGRLEGRLEVERESLAHPRVKVVDTYYIQEEIKKILEKIKVLLSQDSSAVKSGLADLTANLENLLKKIERGTVEEEKREKGSELLFKTEETIKNLQKELAEISSVIEKIETVRSESREMDRKQQQKIRELDAALRTKQDEEKDLALQMERIRFDDEKLDARREAWRMGLAEAGLERSQLNVLLEDYEGFTGEELKKKTERLRGKLDEIGGIDRSVIQEFKDVEGRHSFLSKELEDLRQASKSLKELIRELEEHIKKDFREGFSKIKDEFHNYFRIIFGGGRASLQLVEIPARGAGEESESEFPEEEFKLVEPGIDISVDLPKKRIRGLAMLSGGERALTSIALLFAITAVNPPPFLILDETDAALDEANSQRYSAILKELSQKTQLILITHNRETMKGAGILYGVTMGDDGVSKLLSLKLEEAEVYTNR